MGQGNIFAPVWYSVHKGGLPHCMLGYSPPPPGPEAGTSPPRSKPPREQCKRAVRILLECNLVLNVNTPIVKQTKLSSEDKLTVIQLKSVYA